MPNPTKRLASGDVLKPQCRALTLRSAGAGLVDLEALRAACGPDNPVCELGWNIVGWLGAMVLALGLPAAVLRLGWEWWCVGAAVLVGTPVWADGATPTVILIVAVALPLAAALLTWRGPDRPRWRPFVAAGLLALAVLATVLVFALSL